ncbi:MAG: ABC transporter ATP-binding protein [Acidobacteriota bacterium]
MSDAIRVEGLSKLYRRVAPGAQFKTLKSALLDGSLIGGLRPEEAIAALDEVSFSVPKGQAFGIIGGNGSGKSTLLKIVAGILQPSAGNVEVNGRVAALIELGAGFHPEISGRENIYINGAVLGLSRRQIEERFDDIVEFSGLANFIEEPVKNYSSGMYVRLGFAVAIHTDPEILLVDEVLSVGDEAFSHRCLRRIEEFLAEGRTLLFVSHSLDLMEQLCDRILWLDGGRPRGTGEPRRMIDAYRQSVAEGEAEEHRREQQEQEDEASEASEVEGTERSADSPRRWGSREAEIPRVRLRNASGEETHLLRSGEAAAFELEVHAPKALDDFAFGIAISTPRGVEVWGTNTDLAGFEADRLEGDGVVRIACPALSLAPGEYLVDVALHTRDGVPYDYRRRVLAFTVTAGERGVGVYFPEHRWEFPPAVSWDKGPE